MGVGREPQSQVVWRFVISECGWSGGYSCNKMLMEQTVIPQIQSEWLREGKLKVSSQMGAPEACQQREGDMDMDSHPRTKEPCIRKTLPLARKKIRFFQQSLTRYINYISGQAACLGVLGQHKMSSILL